MSVTIKDVARESGVSPSTVSRVLSNHPRISKTTADKVRQVMEELGYHSNSVARSLVSSKTFTIGMILPRPRDVCADRVVLVVSVGADIDLLLLIRKANDIPFACHVFIATVVNGDRALGQIGDLHVAPLPQKGIKIRIGMINVRKFDAWQRFNLIGLHIRSSDVSIISLAI